MEKKRGKESRKIYRGYLTFSKKYDTIYPLFEKRQRIGRCDGIGRRDGLKIR